MNIKSISSPTDLSELHKLCQGLLWPHDEVVGFVELHKNPILSVENQAFAKDEWALYTFIVHSQHFPQHMNQTVLKTICI